METEKNASPLLDSEAILDENHRPSEMAGESVEAAYSLIVRAALRCEMEADSLSAASPDGRSINARNARANRLAALILRREAARLGGGDSAEGQR